MLITCCALQGSARLKLPALAARALAVLMQSDAANQQQVAAAGAAPSLLRLLTQQEAAPQHATLLGGWLLGRRLLEQRVEAAAASASHSSAADDDPEEDSLCLDVSFVNKRTQLRNLDATSREALWRVLSAGTSSLVTAKEAAGALRVLAAGEVAHHLFSNPCGYHAPGCHQPGPPGLRRFARLGFWRWFCIRLGLDHLLLCCSMSEVLLGR